MSTVFVGGSRHISRLSAQVTERLSNITTTGAHVIVGDANGADKAAQKFFYDQSYRNVTVYCSGNTCRNNVGQWETQNIAPPEKSKGFDFYAAKDREMAREADFGLMIWDGKSKGTILNILRLIAAGKKAVLINVPDKTTETFKSSDDWEKFISRLSSDLRADLRKRATNDEWTFSSAPRQMSFAEDANAAFDAAGDHARSIAASEQQTAEMNAALARGDATTVVDTLGNIARLYGMRQISQDTGLARESLYRSLSSGGNPEFSTVLKVISSLGLRLTVGRADEKL